MGMSRILDQVRDLPSRGTSIRASSRLRSLKESMSFKLPTQPWHSSMNLVILKSPIKAQGVVEHKACVSLRSWMKRGFSDLSLSPHTEVIHIVRCVARSLGFTKIENLVDNWLIFSNSFPFHPMSWPPKALIESSTSHSFIIPPRDRRGWKVGERRFVSWRAITSKSCRKNKISDLSSLIKVTESAYIPIQNNHKIM